MLLSSRYSSIVCRWCLVVKQLNKTTLSLLFPLEFAPFFYKVFFMCVFSVLQSRTSLPSLYPFLSLRFLRSQIQKSRCHRLFSCCAAVREFRGAFRPISIAYVEAVFGAVATWARRIHELLDMKTMDLMKSIEQADQLVRLSPEARLRQSSHV